MRNTGYAKSRLAFAHNVHPPVFKPFDVGDARRDPDLVNRLFGFFRSSAAKQHQTERLSLIDAAVDHQLITIFEYVEGNGDLWKQDEIGEREKRDIHQII